MLIKMLTTVRPGIPMLAKPDTFLIEGETYTATANPHGAICGICENGDTMGVRPGEFIFLSAPQKIFDLWKRVYPDAVAACKIKED